MPPIRLCQAVETNGSRGSEMRGEEKEPTAHMTAANTHASRPSSVASPSGLSSRTSPPKPTSTAPSDCHEIRSPVDLRSRITHSGIEATSSAARPDGTVCWATEITAFAPGSIRPTNAADSSSARVGLSTLRPLRHARIGNRIKPTAMNRVPAASSGGIVSTMSAMPR